MSRGISVWLGLVTVLWAGGAGAQDPLPWQRPAPANPGYASPAQGYGSADPYGAAPRTGLSGATASNDGYGNEPPSYGQSPSTSGSSSPGYGGYDPSPGAGPQYGQQPYGQPPSYGAPPPYAPPPAYGPGPTEPGYGRSYEPGPQPPYYGQSPPSSGERYSNDRPPSGSYSMDEIMDAGRGFFGSVSQGLASVIEYSFQKSGRPNGYILGEDGGGAFFAGLRYGEGRLHTKDAGRHKVYWQGPSIGYDVGGEGSKVMILVYNLTSPEDIYSTFSGIAGAAYLVGGVGITFQTHNDMVLAPIRAGIGLRLGANVGYLKYTRAPTWNPF